MRAKGKGSEAQGGHTAHDVISNNSKGYDLGNKIRLGSEKPSTVPY